MVCGSGFEQAICTLLSYRATVLVTDPIVPLHDIRSTRAAEGALN